MPRQERAAEPEQRLIEAAQRDPVRFAELYEMHFERVYAFVARRVHDRGEAEDITSEVFHRALANLSRFEWRGTPFAAWLYRIAHNAIVSRREPMASASNLPDPADPGPPPEEEIAEAERRAQLFRSVDELPPDQRRVIVLRFAQERSFREIAEELKRTEGAVKQLQVRALENLRARMEEYHG